ncbi:Tox-REase-5 domain-containing protein [Herbaspirillum sp. C7C8]|uniref:Tox-REase-5 domain-containing protein n=1 Tax=Herbaspirillum sp. C7C8 TaxID=2736665 RepID=UPI001F5213B5|nr:Tox-REase-5 domain-containing protein [Herbaspirillum sp. C7C8]MCI1004260.1 hypothetical protein [Herbaspirillum sp. C7C8]
MAAAAIPVIEAVGVRVLAALGVSGLAGAADEAARRAARKKQEEAERAKAMPIARAESTSKARRSCRDCPADQGKVMRRTFPVRYDWVDYQARIGGMSNGPNFIDEWEFNDRDFDGFVSAECLLKEAKGGYDRFFDEWGRPKKWWAYNVDEMIEKILDQSKDAVPRPPVRLAWFWQEPLSYRYFSKILGPVVPDVPHYFLP